MIAALLAFAEQNDVFSARCLSQETVRSIAVMRIMGAVYERQPQDRQRRLDFADESDFPSKMHYAMKSCRGRSNRLVQRNWLVRIDRVRADVNYMRQFHLGECIQYCFGHEHVLDQHAHVIKGRSSR